jgi:hypothetical protein
MASDRPRATTEQNLDSLRELALQFLDASQSVRNRASILSILHTIEPFSSFPDVTAEIVKEHDNAK